MNSRVMHTGLALLLLQLQIGGAGALAFVGTLAGAGAGMLAINEWMNSGDNSTEAMKRRSLRGLENLPRTASEEPIFTCESVAKGAGSKEDTPWAAKHREAMGKLCADSQNQKLMEVFLDTRFKAQYEKHYKKDGWLDEAWVNYVSVSSAGSKFDILTQKLVESIHNYSKKPIVVINFGVVAPPSLDPARFPNLILLHARALPSRPHNGAPNRISFNFNKLRAVILARVKAGGSLDSDTVMVGPQGDALIERTKEEINEKYPFPMMPTHFLDRNPDHKHFKKDNFLTYDCTNCPKPTMRWGQAHPTWTFYSMPFFSRWLSAKLYGRDEQGVPTRNIGEDEDLLNVALWQEGATKAWCAFQMGGVDFMWENYYPEHAPGPYPYWYDDPVGFKTGVPIAFYFGHSEKKIDEIDRVFGLIQNYGKEKKLPKPFFHNMTFFDTFKEMKAAHPTLNCTL